ncbi:MAG: ATP-grasp domain-containing protein [Candidatus Nezhaarchaeales archaeon]
MKIAVYEYFTAVKALNDPSWIEGNSMLNAAIEDFRRAGYEVEVVESIPPKRPVDLVVLIAPSIGRTLYGLVKACEDEGLEVVDSPSTAVFLATDKALLSRNLELCGIKTPKTIVSRFENGLEAIEKALITHSRVVVKPADGDGCAGLCLVSDMVEARKALNVVKQSSKLPYFLIQEFTDGLNLSVSILACEDLVIPISINMQNIHLEGPSGSSRYLGSVVPYEHNEKVLDVAVRAVRSLGNVKGFFGVDVVLKKNEPYVIEVNPRLTTSYLALREISEDNILEMLVKSYFDKNSLKPIKLRGRAIVEKLVADRDMVLSTLDVSLRLPSGAKLLSTIVDGRHAIRKGEAYALYVMRDSYP